MDEMNAGIEQAAAKLRSGRAGTQNPPRRRSTGDNWPTRNEPWARLTSSGATMVVPAVVTGCASGIGAQVARGSSTELGAEVVGLRHATPAVQLKEFHASTSSDPASIDQAATRRLAARSTPCSTSPGVSSGIGDPLRGGHDQLPWHPACSPRRWSTRCRPALAIANVVVARWRRRPARENAAVTAGLLDTVTMAGGSMVQQSGGGRRRGRLPAVEGGDHSSTGWPTSAALGAKADPDQLHRPGSPTRRSSTNCGPPTDRSS